MLASIFAEMELKRIKARVTAAHKHLRKTDRWAGGQPPYGYRIVDRPGGGRTLEPDPVTSEAVSHFRGPAFAKIADGFAAAEGGWENIALTPTTDYGLGLFVDRDQADRWRDYWEERAVLGLLTQAENRSRPRA